MPIASRLVLGTSIAHHIGGRWAISWIAYVINIPINMLGMLSNIVDARDASLSRWLLIWLLGYLALGAVLLIANFSLFSNRRVSPVPVWWVVALGAIAGGTRGVVVGVLADEWGLSGGGVELVATRILTGALLGAILIPAAAFLLSVIASYSTKRKELLTELVDLERRRMQSEGESQRLREVLAANVEEDAKQAVAEQTGESARELSHRMWQEAQSHDDDGRTSIAWRSVLRDVFINYPYPGAIVAAVWAVSALGSVVVAVGVIRGLAQVVVSVVVIWGAFALASRISFHTSAARVGLLVVTLSVVVVLTGPLASLAFDPRPLATGAGQVIANTVWLPTLAVVVGVIVSAIRSSEQVVDGLVVDVRGEEVAALAAAQETSRIQRELAEALHNIQTRIFAARTAGAEVSVEDLLFRRSLYEPREQFTALLDTWGALMNVIVEADLPALVDHEIDRLTRIVGEALSNAYRHGEARTVVIKVSRDAAGLRVQVSDDGKGPVIDWQAGLGSALLESLAPRAWTLDRNAEGSTVLDVLLRDGEA